MTYVTFKKLSIEKKQIIFDAIGSELLENGWDNGKVVNICKRANIPRSAFYRYFESIDDAYSYYIEAKCLQYNEELEFIITGGSQDPFDKSRKIMQILLDNRDMYFIVENINKSHITKIVMGNIEKYSGNSFKTEETEEDKKTSRLIMKVCRQIAFEYYELGISKEQAYADYDFFVSTCKRPN